MGSQSPWGHDCVTFTFFLMCVFFIFKISFDVDQFLKGFIEFVTALLVFYACFFFFFLAVRHVGS